MKLKPVIKTTGKPYLVPWIIEMFPENYREMAYLEPFLGSGEVILNKDRSAEEVVNEPDAGLASVWRAVRDEAKALSVRLRKTDHTERTFSRHLSKRDTDDYMQIAVSEFVLRHMSRGGAKKTYLPREKSKEHFLEPFLARFQQAEERLGGVYIMSRDPVSLIAAFSHEGTLVYCDPPPVEEIGEEMHMELGDALRSFKGKAVVTARNSALYKRTYAEWNRKGVPGHPKESVWLNF